jgi:hypothetical protein
MREFKKVVYVAGPISKGPLCENIFRACKAGMELLKAGVSPHVPHLTCYMGQVFHLGSDAVLPEVLPSGTVHEDWYGMDLLIVDRCDAVLRLSGESRGADLEVARAKERGIPVFETVEAVIAWAQ